MHRLYSQCQRRSSVALSASRGGIQYRINSLSIRGYVTILSYSDFLAPCRHKSHAKTLICLSSKTDCRLPSQHKRYIKINYKTSARKRQSNPQGFNHCCYRWHWAPGDTLPPFPVATGDKIGSPKSLCCWLVICTDTPPWCPYAYQVLDCCDPALLSLFPSECS